MIFECKCCDVIEDNDFVRLKLMKLLFQDKYDIVEGKFENSGNFVDVRLRFREKVNNNV